MLQMRVIHRASLSKSKSIQIAKDLGVLRTAPSRRHPGVWIFISSYIELNQDVSTLHA